MIIQKNSGVEKQAPRDIEFKEFVIKELSAVDDPAQEGAVAVLIKHRTDNKITLEENAMDPKELEKKIKELEAQLAKANAEVENLTLEVSMSDAQRSHYAKLNGKEKDSFLKMSQLQRQSVLDEIEKQNTPVYTCMDGTVIRKSDGDLTLRLAKMADSALKSAAANAEAAEAATFAKSADEILGDLPKDEKTKVALLKAISKIEDKEIREGILEMLKAANDAAAESLFMKGRSTTKDENESEDDSAEEALEKYISKKAKEYKLDIIRTEKRLADEKDEEYITLYEETQLDRGLGGEIQ